MGAAAVALVLLLIPFIRNAGDEMIALQTWIGQLGIMGPVAFIAAVVLLTSIFIPASLLATAGGALFGLGWGTCYMSVDVILAAASCLSLFDSMTRNSMVTFCPMAFLRKFLFTRIKCTTSPSCEKYSCA
jgi:uncharacterized membrane protein YdjX (TVP38/TMEM64 family)